ncbi:uncharacterized protein LOC113287091 [Papaver somniferum]|uniref:uncharacterized protein LOC113287091 n=1 Tax=Papaver somniferum TaxID=3469 RepID=UPI000E6F505B|nr:uncharacterized protein LOC113287091 [Papaver somniferum]
MDIYVKTEEEKKKKMKLIQISLPIELILEFLSRLPVKSLTRLSCASKYLYNYINQNPQFTKSHFINYSQKNPTLVFYTNYVTGKQQCLFQSLFRTRDIQDDERDNHDVQLYQKTIQQKKGEFVGYCNGLSCFRNTITEFAFFIDVWNDTTQEVLRMYSKGGEVRSPNSGLLRTCASAVFTSYGAAGAGAGGGGALFWWTTDPQVILLFDLHEDKLQYIRIPLEYNTRTRWFEYEGFLVIARLEKKSPTSLTLGKVHLKVLKAFKDDQVWAEETIDLSAYSIPFSNNFRFVSFSDQGGCQKFSFLQSAKEMSQGG